MSETSPLLLERIRAAFSENRYPGDDKLTVYNVGGRPYDETFQLLRGRQWQDMPVADFMRGDTPIPDLTAEAFHYYMPALLIGALANEPDAAWSLAFYLTPSNFEQLANAHGDASFRERFWESMACFDSEQREVISEVLREFVRREWLEEDEVTEAVQFFRSPPRSP